jgi:hypothetical protein
MMTAVIVTIERRGKTTYVRFYGRLNFLKGFVRPVASRVADS